MLSILIEYQPVRMILHHLRNNVLMRRPASLSILDPQREPPNLRIDLFLMEVVHHLFDGVTGESIFARTPITIGVEPAIVQRGPVDSELLQFRDRAGHLFGRDVKLISPSAPRYSVVLVGGLRQLPPFFL